MPISAPSFLVSHFCKMKLTITPASCGLAWAGDYVGTGMPAKLQIAAEASGGLGTEVAQVHG